MDSVELHGTDLAISSSNRHDQVGFIAFNQCDTINHHSHPHLFILINDAGRQTVLTGQLQYLVVQHSLHPHL